MNKFLLSAAVFLLLASRAQAEETITVTSYYPSPYGVYNELRLYPRTTEPSACDANNRGAIYYNNTTGSLQVCSASGWAAVTGSTGGAVKYGGSYLLRGGWSPGCITANIYTGGCSCPSGYTARQSSLGGYYHMSEWDSYYQGFSCEQL